MPDTFEHRIAAAAEAIREHQLTTKRCAELRAQIVMLTKQVDDLRAQHALEQRDVERLESLSLTRILVSLREGRDEALARETAEADAARYRVADAQARLDAVRSEHGAAELQLDRLADAPAVYAATLDRKEQRIREVGGELSAPLIALADERGRLGGELHEVREALQAADSAWRALTALRDTLSNAAGWSTYDTFFGGGAISSAIKHSRLDEAARLAAQADQRLSVLRTELADVPGVKAHVPGLAVDGLTRFIDVWFDNIFTDLAVRDRIKQAQANVDRSMQLVKQVHTGLKRRAEQANTRLAAIEAERQRLLTTKPA